MYIWGKGRATGQTFCRQSRVGSGQRFVGSGRVQEKWPVDNSALASLRQERTSARQEFIENYLIFRI